MPWARCYWPGTGGYLEAVLGSNLRCLGVISLLTRKGDSGSPAFAGRDRLMVYQTLTGCQLSGAAFGPNRRLRDLLGSRRGARLLGTHKP